MLSAELDAPICQVFPAQFNWRVRSAQNILTSRKSLSSHVVKSLCLSWALTRFKQTQLKVGDRDMLKLLEGRPPLVSQQLLVHSLNVNSVMQNITNCLLKTLHKRSSFVFPPSFAVNLGLTESSEATGSETRTLGNGCRECIDWFISYVLKEPLYWNFTDLAPSFLVPYWAILVPNSLLFFSNLWTSHSVLSTNAQPKN